MKHCMDEDLEEHQHYRHEVGGLYQCPAEKGCELRFDNVCQIITHLEDHVKLCERWASDEYWGPDTWNRPSKPPLTYQCSYGCEVEVHNAFGVINHLQDHHGLFPTKEEMDRALHDYYNHRKKDEDETP